MLKPPVIVRGCISFPMTMQIKLKTSQMLIGSHFQAAFVSAPMCPYPPSKGWEII